MISTFHQTPYEFVDGGEKTINRMLRAGTWDNGMQRNGCEEETSLPL
jgi:hypothetical protein